MNTSKGTTQENVKGPLTNAENGKGQAPIFRYWPIAKILQPYVKTFPAAYYEHIYRLNNWDYNSKSSKRPGVIGHWTNDIIYARLAPAVLEELKRRATRDEKGRLKAKLFQMLTPEMGHPKLVDHFKEVMAIMRGARNWAEFYEMLDRSLPRFNETLQLPFYDTQAMERLPVQPSNVFD